MPSPANAGPARHDAATINQKRISAPFATCGEVTVGTWTGKCRERFALDSAFLPSGGAVFPLCSKCRWRRTDRSRPADANRQGPVIRRADPVPRVDDGLRLRLQRRLRGRPPEPDQGRPCVPRRLAAEVVQREPNQNSIAGCPRIPRPDDPSAVSRRRWF